MSDWDSYKASKFLSFVLRHRPDIIGIQLDGGGWVEIDVLVEASVAHGKALTRELLKETVRTDDKQRYVIEGTKIRANQGHSVDVDLAIAELAPPTLLYHGTATRFLDQIRNEGLKKMSRNHVHLSEDVETAKKVGQRHGKPVVLAVLATSMTKDGHKFYLANNGIWLTDHVPSIYIAAV